jgi:hypothetical protein
LELREEGEESGGGEQGVEITQTMYAHVNKRIIIILKRPYLEKTHHKIGLVEWLKV